MKTFMLVLIALVLSVPAYAQYGPPVVWLDTGVAPPVVVIYNPNGYLVPVPVRCEGISLTKRKFYSEQAVYHAPPGESRHRFPINVFYWYRINCW